MLKNLKGKMTMFWGTGHVILITKKAYDVF